MDNQTKAPSVMDALDASMTRTKSILFAPFDVGKWFTLGFCAFLAQLGQGGGINLGNPFGGGSDREGLADKIGPWVMAHLALVITLGTAVLLLAVALGILLTWIGSRGEFMFLDGVVRDKAAVSEPWRRFRRLGNSLFVFRIVIGLAGLALVLLLAGLGLLLAWPDVRDRHFDFRAIAAIAGGGCLVLLVVLALVLVKVLLRDFVVPIMYRREITASEAFRAFRSEVLPGRVPNFVLFYLMMFVVGLAAGVLILVGTCLTCCIAALPYISSVVFLPILVFFRCYSLFFLEQCGEEWHLTGPPMAPPPPAAPPPQPGAPSEAPDLPSPPGPRGDGGGNGDGGPIVPI